MPIIILIIVVACGGFFVGKEVYQKPVTAGNCVDTATKSLGEKYDDIMNIIKQ